MILLIDGTVSFYNNEELLEEKKSICFLDTKKIKTKNKMYFKLGSIIAYSNYEEIISKSKELQNVFNNKLSLYRNFTILNLLEEEELFELISSILQKEYKKNDILINEENKCEYFYLLINGEVKHKFYNDETVIRYSDGDCFGEIFLLDGEGEFLKDSYVVVTSEKLSTLEIPKEIFFELLQKPKINDFIKVKMCLEDKSILLSDLYYITNLGKGKFGNVYLVHNGIFIYAIKVVCRHFIKNTSKAWKYLQNENNILKLLNFQFIIKLVKTFKTKEYVFFLMEYSTGSQLDSILDILVNRTTINIVKFYGGILFLILDYLSKQKIIHRDIKPSNIMVDSNGYIKLVDFGAAKRILNGYAKTMIGTPFYMAPEIVAGKNYSFPSDYYSVGICLYYMYYRKYPFGMGINDVYLIYQEILKKQLNFNGLSNQNHVLNDLIKHLLDKEPALRISSLDNIKSHPFFKDFDWDLLFAKKLNPPYLPANGRNYTEQYLKNLSKPFDEFIEEESINLIKNGNLKGSELKEEESESINGDNSWIDGF
jgi:cGMP-dependent protein kinase